MAKFVPDVTTNRWVVIAEGRSKRPKEEKVPIANVNKICVFCPGFEKIPGEELYRLGEGKAYEPGWKVRVIANKYPICDFHEVIIHSPDDKVDIPDLPLEQVELVLKAFRDRFNANRVNGHVIIFNNVGEAGGASIHHPHSQLVVVPKQITLDSLELEPTNNVVVDNNHFVVFCPEFSQWPFEMWIAPKKRKEFFGQVTDDVLHDLAEVLQSSLKRLIGHLDATSHIHPGMPMVSFKEGPAYNFYVHFGSDWYIRIIPRLIHRAGFELGTGISVNIVDPVDAAEILKQDLQQIKDKRLKIKDKFF
ncbi:MAG: hypothetical protein NUV69_00160 [Candidatus Curtissbacteria bacterium]|nr:hypothetical protein [Candidatus Curtissbacteria bacterium]